MRRFKGVIKQFVPHGNLTDQTRRARGIKKGFTRPRVNPPKKPFNDLMKDLANIQNCSQNS